MQSTSHNFIVHASVQFRINNLVLGSIERTVVSRCVGGYSVSLGIRDKIAKIHYRVIQQQKLYPDWIQSCTLLDNRKFKWLTTGDNNPSLEICFNVFFLPWIALEACSQNSGEHQLRLLIEENNKLTTQKI